MIIPTLQKNKITEIIYLSHKCVDILIIENTNEGKIYIENFLYIYIYEYHIKITHDLNNLAKFHASTHKHLFMDCNQYTKINEVKATIGNIVWFKYIEAYKYCVQNIISFTENPASSCITI